MCDYLNSPLFKKYSSSSNEITLYYQLLKLNNQFKNSGLAAYKNEFSSNVNKNEFSGLITISKNSTLYNLKIEISKITGFPIKTMVGFGCLEGEYYDEFGDKWERINPYYINENILILNSHYNNSMVAYRYIYIYIDITRDEIFSSINENQINNDKTIKKLEEKEKENKNKISKLELIIENLTSENNQNKKKISIITNENKRLTELNDKRQEEKKKHEKNSKDCNDKFKIEKNNIKNIIFKVYFFILFN